jgi:hypothetical protein
MKETREIVMKNNQNYPKLTNKIPNHDQKMTKQ